MGVPAEIRDLTERFERNLDAYRSPQYNETQLRREFLDPSFKALGWDIDNEQGYAEAYKDVIHEDAIKLGEQMLDLQQRLSAVKTPREKTALERQIAVTDTQIDRLVYDLYGLNDDEI